MAYGTVNVPGVAELEQEKLRAEIQSVVDAKIQSDDLKDEIRRVVGGIVPTSGYHMVFEVEDWEKVKDKVFELRIPKSRHNVEPATEICTSKVRQRLGRNVYKYIIESEPETHEEVIAEAIKALTEAEKIAIANNTLCRMKPSALTGLTVGSVEFPANILAPGGTEEKPVELAVTVNGSESLSFTLKATFEGTAKYADSASAAKSGGTALTSGTVTDSITGDAEAGSKVLYIYVQNSGVESFYKLTVTKGEADGTPVGKKWDTNVKPYPTHEQGNDHVELTWEQLQLYLLEKTLLPAEEAAAKVLSKNITWKPEEDISVVLDTLLAAAYIPALGGSGAWLGRICTFEVVQSLGFKRKLEDEPVEHYEPVGEMFENTWAVMETAVSWDMDTKELVLTGSCAYAGEVLVLGGGANSDDTAASQYEQLMAAVKQVKSELTYVHEQDEPADVWHITHNLSRAPSVTVVDSMGNIVNGTVQYLSESELDISFASAFSGKAYLN